MATNIWTGAAAAVAQVDQLTPGGTIEADDKFIVKMTDPDTGREATVTAQPGGTTVADVCAAVVAAMQASPDPLFRAVTASNQTTHVLVTAVVAGKPFDCTVQTTEAGGGVSDGQTFTRAAVTPSAGPSDYNVAANWSLGHVPTTGEDVDIPPGTPAILFGLNQSGVTIGAFTRHAGASAAIGRWDDGVLRYLRIKPTALTIRGRGSLVAIDVGAETIAPYIEHTGEPEYGRAHAVYVRGTALTGVQVETGYVGICAGPGDAGAVTAAIGVAAGYVTIGAGTTVTGVTLTQLGGTVHARAAVPTVNVHGAQTIYRQQAGNWTTLNAYFGATVHANAGGTYATTKLHSGAKLLKTENAVPVTLTNTEIGAGCRIGDPAARITFTNPVVYPEGKEQLVGAGYT